MYSVLRIHTRSSPPPSSQKAPLPFLPPPPPPPPPASCFPGLLLLPTPVQLPSDSCVAVQLRLVVLHTKPQAATLDFEARVPVPFSIFPSSYKEDKTTPASATTVSHSEVSFQLPHIHHHKPGREGQHSSLDEPTHRFPRIEEEVRITREEERYRRPGVRREEARPRPTFSETTVELRTPIDIAEREYRARYHPSYREEVHSHSTTVDVHRPHHQHTLSAPVENITTVDLPLIRRPKHTKHTSFEDIVEITPNNNNKMVYYDEDASHRASGHKYSEGQSLEVTEYREARPPQDAPIPPNTVTIPCHHIRIGDILMLQGRPCQVIRISTSSATGQHRYLGVDLFTKKLHEESSFVSSPAPSVVVQTMLGPILKQYRVLDLQDGKIVAMTETGDVKQDLPVIDQSNLWTRLQRAFESGRGSVRVLVVSDHGRELAVDLKVVHGVSL